MGKIHSASIHCKWCTKIKTTERWKGQNKRKEHIKINVVKCRSLNHIRIFLSNESQFAGEKKWITSFECQILHK